MKCYGFNFVRIPTDYRFWTKHFEYKHPDESIFEYLDQDLEACRARGIHMSINLHRAWDIASTAMTRKSTTCGSIKQRRDVLDLMINARRSH